jgi:hypothetical protein
MRQTADTRLIGVAVMGQNLVLHMSGHGSRQTCWATPRGSSLRPPASIGTTAASAGRCFFAYNGATILIHNLGAE